MSAEGEPRMKTIEIAASSRYEVRIGGGLLASAGEQLRELTGADTVALVSDDRVFPLYGEALVRSLERAGLRAVSFVFPAGEGSKTMETLCRLLRFLAQNRLARSDALLALGGGVVGDVTGFAASVYLRGLPFVQLPTTLLAAVDASVGGKTGVDLPEGKNLVGSFWQPALVLCDTDVLSALPDPVYRDGCAEVIKYGVIGSAELFEAIRRSPVSAQLPEVIARCVELKRELVLEDEYDRRRRRLLNLGHSFGHAIEAAGGYTLSHGCAVAAGMCIAARAAAEKGICPGAVRDELIDLVRQYGLPSDSDVPAEAMLVELLSDKKRDGAGLRLILPEAIGRCRIETVKPEALRDWLRAGGIV